jgi:hypothetical protein
MLMVPPSARKTAGHGDLGAGPAAAQPYNVEVMVAQIDHAATLALGLVARKRPGLMSTPSAGAFATGPVAAA